MTSTEAFAEWWNANQPLDAHVSAAGAGFLAGAAWRRGEDLEWVKAYARDCGCAKKIAAAIRQEGTG